MFYILYFILFYIIIIIIIVPTSTKPRAWKLSKMLNNGCNDFLFGVHCVIIIIIISMRQLLPVGYNTFYTLLSFHTRVIVLVYDIKLIGLIIIMEFL